MTDKDIERLLMLSIQMCTSPNHNLPLEEFKTFNGLLGKLVEERKVLRGALESLRPLVDPNNASACIQAIGKAVAALDVKS